MFILIHGAYHGGWCWEPFVDALRTRNVEAIAPDLPGHGRDPGWLADQTMENYLARIVAEIDAQQAPVILVGHSMGGAVAKLAAAARPDKVRRIVYLTAYIPANGESVTDGVKLDPASFAEINRHEVEGINALSVTVTSLGRDFYQDADARTLAKVQDRVQLQSPAPFRHKLDVDEATVGKRPAAAVICMVDRAISPGHQRWMAERAGCDPILEIDSGHSPFLTKTEILADMLVALDT